MTTSLESKLPVATVAGAASVFLGIAIGTQPLFAVGIMFLGLAAFAVWCTRFWWGILWVIAPLFLTGSYGFAGSLSVILLAAVVLPLAILWWHRGVGAPPLSPAAMAIVTLLLIAGILLAATRGSPIDQAVFTPLLWFAGILVGTGWAVHQRSFRLSMGVLAILGLLAILESAGVSLPWTELLRSDDPTALYAINRSTSTLGHPVIAGGIFAIAAILTAASTWSGKAKWLVLILLIGGTVSTVTRSALIALVVGIILLVVLHSSTRKGALATLGAGAVIVAVLYGGLLPQLSTTLNTRVFEQQQPQLVRLYAVRIFSDDLQRSPTSLLVGEGPGASRQYLESIGTIYGYTVFDNQYLTLIKEYGALTLLAILMLVSAGLYRSDPRNRLAGAPALASVCVFLLFSDALAWASFGFLAFAVVGLVCAPTASRSSSPWER